jgi:hypothetical protein
VAEAVFGGVPAWLLRAYLVELGGRASSEEAVQGDGWRATLTPGGDGAGGIRIARVTVKLEGEQAATVLAALRKKAQRGGG